MFRYSLGGGWLNWPAAVPQASVSTRHKKQGVFATSGEQRTIASRLKITPRAKTYYLITASVNLRSITTRLTAREIRQPTEVLN